MTQYCRGTREDEQEIRDFADLVFSKALQPHDFKTLLPKLYAPGRESQPYHYLAKEEGRIRAMVGVFPVEFHVAGHLLKAGCVGTVSVHPESRGSGYMKELMRLALRDMEAQGFAFSVLGGQRQRYEYFGYGPAGLQWNCVLTSENVRHAWRPVSAKGIFFRELEEASTELEQVLELYESTMVNGARPKQDFLSILHSWNSRAAAVLCDGCFAGYLVWHNLGSRTCVAEINLKAPELLPAVGKAFLCAQGTAELSFCLPDYEQELVRILCGVCDQFSLTYNHNFRLFDYAAVLRAYLLCKAAVTPLCDGCFSLRVEDWGVVRVQVQSGLPTVDRLEENAPFNCSMNKLDAAAFLFSPRSTLFPEKPPQGWFPAPLFISSQDCC